MFRTEDRTRAVVVGTAAATVAAVALSEVARRLGADLLVTGRGEGPTTVPVGAVVLATVAAGVGAALLAAVSRRTARPRRTFLALCAAGFALALVPPFSGAESAETTAWLVALHGVVAAVLVPLVTRTLPAERTPASTLPAATAGSTR